MVKMETQSNVGQRMDNPANGDQRQLAKNVTEMVSVIEKNDLGSLRRLIQEMRGQNISDPLVKTVLPKKYRHVAGSVMTTPLRVSISWKNIEALKLLLYSDCVIAREDKSLAMQKLSAKRIQREEDIDILDLLLQSGSSMSRPVHYTIAIESLINDGKDFLLKRLLEVHFSDKVSPRTRSYLCFALASKGRTSTAENRSGYFMDKWQNFATEGMLGLLRSGLNPLNFLTSLENWHDLESKYFHTIVCLLPLVIQVSTKPSEAPMAAIFRRASRDFWYPMLKVEERTILHALPKLLWHTNHDLKEIMRLACLSPRFESYVGLNEWGTRKEEVRNLQDICRFTIRTNLNASNVVQGIEKIPFFPKRLQNYMIYKDCLEQCYITDNECLCLSL